MDSLERRLAASLLALRVTVFVVMIMWTLDKFVNPDHASRVFAGFYGVAGLDAVALYSIAAVQLVIVLAFVTGAFRRLSYALVLLLHAVSTLASWPKYVAPWDNLLFFAAWPMLGACLALYWLRDYDRLASVDAWRTR